jgi:class 3 adenylate cyclase
MSAAVACPVCGADVPAGFRFCGQCGSPLAEPPAVAEERKVVTTLICDLVGFTGMSEAADPEVVDAVLRTYHAAARRVIESHGGTVEKFIGDAVVGVFGVPAVHEDDPERAVRAGLRLLEAVEGLKRPDGSPLQVRVGVNTGEALARLDVSPGSGEGFLTGDAVNTAARLQAAAPPGGVAVGALTRALTQHAIIYEELPPVVAKGKAEPVPAWLASGAVARRGVDAGGDELTPLVGREVELTYLSAIFDKAASQASPQFALLIGEPGIGKSRLVRELSARVDGRPEMTTWRQGYCPPFGEDVTYWALAEIIKGHAGIRDSDELAAVEAKLEAVLPPGADQEWFRQRLRALLGLPAPEAPREQSFAAWLRFFEGIAAAEPTVLVFEDLHWADAALLDFLEYLTSHLADVPLLVVGTARPELFERRPGFAAGAAVTRVNLGPLSAGETARLVAGLLTEPGERASAVGEVVQRCGGNPFYAEQSARLLADTSLDLPLPDSVQAVIAARLDTLPADEKALLGDASVIGGVFWEGAVTALSKREPQDIEAMLSRLLEHRLVRRVRESSMEGECEYSFAHALAREVAYRQLPKAVRARRHAAAAAWLEQRTGERAGDFADILAYHLSTAIGLAQAVGDGDLVADLREPAVTWLRVSGDRAQSVDVAVARRQYERALEIATGEHPARPRLLLSLGDMLALHGEYPVAAVVLEEARELFERQGDILGHVRSLLRLNYVLRLTAHERPELVTEALALARTQGVSRELIEALDVWAWSDYLSTGDPRRGLEAIEEARSHCAELGIDVPTFIRADSGSLRCALGDPGGLDDFRLAVHAAQSSDYRGLGFELSGCMCNYAVAVDWVEGPTASAAVLADCIAFLERRGMTADAEFMRNMGFESRLMTGHWASLQIDIEAAQRELSEAVFLVNASVLLPLRLLVAAWTGQPDGLEEDAAAMHAALDDFSLPWHEAYDAVSSAAALDAAGRPQEAAVALAAWSETPQLKGTVEYAWLVPAAIRLALRCSGRELAERLRHRGDGLLPVQHHVMTSVEASLAEAAGESETAAAGFADAARRWHDFGVPFEEGHALLGRGRCLVVLGRALEAAKPLAAARELFARLGAQPALAETDEWRAKAGAPIES